MDGWENRWMNGDGRIWRHGCRQTGKVGEEVKRGDEMK